MYAWSDVAARVERVYDRARQEAEEADAAAGRPARGGAGELGRPRRQQWGCAEALARFSRCGPVAGPLYCAVAASAALFQVCDAEGTLPLQSICPGLVRLLPPRCVRAAAVRLVSDG